MPLWRLRRLASEVYRRVLDRRPRIQRWEDRARRHGVRAVLNLGHPEAEIGPVTEFQRRELFPILRAALTGDEKLILDFGCGPGRFTGDLADLIGGRAIGVDPVESLLRLAPAHPRIEYRTMPPGQIPVASAAVDVLWICLVLGGIHGRSLENTVGELHRVLKPGGLLFLVENTSEGRGDSFWAFRSVGYYQKLFAPTPLDNVHEYRDLGERISVMLGRTQRS